MFIKLYFLALPVFLAMDMIWLVFVAKGFYQKQIGLLMKQNINWSAAVLFYLLFIVGLIVFVVIPSLEKNSWTQAVMLGAFFGLITYATYDLTNLATLKNWPLAITVVDLLWGMVLSASVATITHLIASKIGL